ncbi:MAG: hypothetical protein COA79_17445 [Planctomycetota bacterium]|nr:MAG: hypothetical protein COA79_17445 [Planctomycetota bacterium]
MIDQDFNQFTAICIARIRTLKHVMYLTAVLLFTTIAVCAESDSFFKRVVKINRILEPELDIATMRSKLDKLLNQLRPKLVSLSSSEEKVAYLNRILLANRKVAYISNKYWRDSTLVASLIRGKGNCLATSTLYVVVGKELKLPLHMVLMPGHAFACWAEDKQRINIETTAGGKRIPTLTYLRRNPRPEPEEVVLFRYGKPLTENEVIAELLSVAATHRAGQNRYIDAVELLNRSIRLAPDRLDRQLYRIQLLSNLSGKRKEAERAIRALIQKKGCPRSIQTAGFLFLARYAGARGDHQHQRKLLLSAFKVSPKRGLLKVLDDLAFCHHSLNDHVGAIRYMELSIKLYNNGDTRVATALHGLAILQRHAGQFDLSLRSIRSARKFNPEDWALQMMEAKLLVLQGKRKEGILLHARIKQPRAQATRWGKGVATFHAVCGEREKFFTAFAEVMKEAKDPYIMHWVDKNRDLDPFRNDPRFKKIVPATRKRLMGDKVPSDKGIDTKVPNK